MFSRNVQFAPGGRNHRRRPRRSVREASDDRGFNGSGWPDFTWENGDISALPGRSCFPTDTFDHRCIRRRCPESLSLPRHRSHKYVNRSGSDRKMGTSLPYLVGPASRLTRLITDASDEDVLNPYRSQGIEVTST